MKNLKTEMPRANAREQEKCALTPEEIAILDFVADMHVAAYLDAGEDEDKVDWARLHGEIAAACARLSGGN